MLEAAAVTVQVEPKVQLWPLTVVVGLVHVIADAPPPADVNTWLDVPEVAGRLKLYAAVAALFCTVTVAPNAPPLANPS
jgi:hypothetical protein